MNPTDIVAGENAWIEDVDLGNGRKGFSRVVTYADGRKVRQVYERGVEGGPIREEDAGVNLEVKATYDKWVRDNTPVRTDVRYNPAAGQPGHDPSIPVGTAIKTETPQGGTPRVAGTEQPKPTTNSAATPGQQADDTRKQQEQVERERNQAAGLGPITDVEKIALDDKRKKDDEAKENKWTEISRNTVKDETTGISKVVITEQNENGKTRTREASEQVTKEPPKPTLIDDPNRPGGKLSVIPDPSQPAGVRIERVALPGEGERKPIPTSGDLKGELGTLVPNAIKRRDELTAIYNAGGMDKAEYDRQAKQIMDDANSRYTELQGLLSAQNSITGQQAAQRNATITEGNGNTSFAGSALERAMKGTMTPYAGGPGSGQTSADAMRALLNIQTEYAKSVGGLRQTPEVQPTPYQKHILSIDPSGGIRIETGAGGAPAIADPGNGADLLNLRSQLAPAAGGGNEEPSPVGVGSPDFSTLMQDYQDDNDPDWNSALAMIGQEVGIG